MSEGDNASGEGDPLARVFAELGADQNPGRTRTRPCAIARPIMAPCGSSIAISSIMGWAST
jgi:hypothetical protein